jgi:YbbR domain-containing protein
MKRILEIISSFFKRLFEKDLVIKILSIVAAIVIWFTVSINAYPTVDRVIYNVPVTIDMQGTYAEAHNFKVINQSITEVDIYIQGERGEIGNLTADDLKVTASAENVINAADYSLPLEVSSISGKNFSVTKITPADNSKLSVETTDVSFDEIITKEISIRPLMDNVHVANGFISDDDDVVIAPDRIEITGPKDQVDGIEDVYFYVEADGELSETYEYTAADPVIYSDGSPISEEEGISFSKTSFNVSVPILKRQTLPLTVLISNAPESFDTSAFMDKLEFSVTELEVAAPVDMIKEDITRSIGTIDMREVNIGSVFRFNTADFLPEGYQNLSGIDSVTVTCPSDGLYWITMSIRGSSIQIVNAPVQFDCNIITSGFTLTFIGSEESIENLSYIDVVSQIDLINYELEEGDYKFPVTFSTPAYDDVWCIGSDGVLSPKAVVTVTLKS